MNVTANVRFLNSERREYTSNNQQRVGHSVNFLTDDAPLTVWVSETPETKPMLDRLAGALFGDKFAATFRLIPRDKYYSLVLTAVEYI